MQRIPHGGNLLKPLRREVFRTYDYQFMGSHGSQSTLARVRPLI